MTANDESGIEFDAEMIELRQRYLESLRATRAVVREAMATGDHAALRTLAHQTRGAAGMYGYPELSETAGLLEDAIFEKRDEALIRELTDEFIRGIETVVAEV